MSPFKECNYFPDQYSTFRRALQGLLLGSGWVDAFSMLVAINLTKDDGDVGNLPAGAAPGSEPGANNEDIEVDAGDFAAIGMAGLPTQDMKISRLREGIERFLITDINNPAGSAEAQSTIWVLADAIDIKPDEFNHIPGGANVLYMDGHVEFSKFPGDWPVNNVFAAMNNQNWF